METAAIYWEPKIKTYGFSESINLSLIKLIIKIEQISEWGFYITELANLGVSFNLVLIQYLNNKILVIYLLCQRKLEIKIQKYITDQMQAGIGESVQIKSPVELIYFHGPHFGDRNGIIDSVFRVLSIENIPILVSGCSGASIHLVLPEKGIKKAKPFLINVFEVPQSVDKL